MGDYREAISPAKDVDCVTVQNLAGVFKGDAGVFYPCTAKAVVDTLDHYGVEMQRQKRGCDRQEPGGGKTLGDAAY